MLVPAERRDRRYAAQVRAGGDDLRIRLAFRYADEEGGAPDPFALPPGAEEAVDRGLALLAAWHAVRPDATKAAALAQEACVDDDVARLALQLGGNDSTAAFAAVAAFPALAAAAGAKERHADVFEAGDARRELRDKTPPPAALIRGRSPSNPSLLDAAAAGPGGLPAQPAAAASALNRLGIRKARPKRKPSLGPAGFGPARSPTTG